MVNLNGYHFQGTSGTGGGEAPAGSGLLLLASSYPESFVTPPLVLSDPKIADGKKCYIGYSLHDIWGTPVSEPDLSNVIDAFYGPYYFAAGMREVAPTPLFPSDIGSYLDPSGNVVSGPPEAADVVHCNFLYAIIGEPAPDAAWHSTLPDDGFVGNTNTRVYRPSLYAYRYPLSLSYWTANAAVYNSRFGTGGQYKFNGRYVATGSGSAGSGNINTKLKQYDGAIPFAPGLMSGGPLSYIRDQLYNPRFDDRPFGNYSISGSIVNPNVLFYNSLITTPSIKTTDGIGNPATAMTVSTNPSYIGFYYMMNSGPVWPEAVTQNDPFKTWSLFPGYNYTGERTGLILPTYYFGYIFTSEAITL